MWLPILHFNLTWMTLEAGFITALRPALTGAQKPGAAPGASRSSTSDCCMDGQFHFPFPF